MLRKSNNKNELQAKFQKMFRIDPGLYKRGDQIYWRRTVKGKPTTQNLQTGDLKKARRIRDQRIAAFGPMDNLETIENFSAVWLRLHCQNRSRLFLQTTTSRVRKYLIPCLGAIPLAALKLEEILEYRRFLEKKDLAPETVKSILSDLRCLLNAAMRIGKIKTTPFISSQVLPKVKKSKPKELTPDQIIKIEATSAPKALAAIRLARLIGARYGELARMKWSDLYLDAKNPHIILSNTKSGEIRSVFLNGEALEHIEWIRETFEETDFILPARPANPRQFIGRYNARLRRTKYFSGFKWNFHMLRHTFAFTCLNKGVPVEVLQKLLGHSTPEMTQRYARLADSTTGDVFNRFMN